MTSKSSDPSTVTTTVENNNCGVLASVSSISDTIKTGVTSAIDKASTDIVLLAHDIACGYESLAKSTEAMVFPQQKDDGMKNQQPSSNDIMMTFPPNAFKTTVATSVHMQMTGKESTADIVKDESQSKSKSILSMAQDALRRKKLEQAKTVTSRNESEIKKRRKSTTNRMPLKAHNR